MPEEKEQFQPKNFGLILPVVKPESWHFGAVSPVNRVEVFKDGHGWEQFLPTPEQQARFGFEPMCCVSESANNVVETLAKCLFDINLNNSDRFLAKMSGTSANGNDGDTVFETLRKCGFVDEQVWPYPDPPVSWQGYYQPIPSSKISLGKQALTTWQINHEFITITHQSLKEALKYGPVQVYVYAWQIGGNGRYIDGGNTPNHAVMLFDYVEGECWKIYDSYSVNYDWNDVNYKNYVKELDWNFSFSPMGKVCYLTKVLKKNESWLSVLSHFLINILTKVKILPMLKNFYRDTKSGAYYFVKVVTGKPMKQKIDTVGGILTLLDVNFGAKGADFGELNQYKDTVFFN